MSDTCRVGILLSNDLFQKLLRGKKGNENVDFYLDEARNLEMEPCFFRLKDISLETGKTQVLIPNEEHFIIDSIPTPQVIHNRGMQLKKSARSKILALEKQGHRIFNRFNRYGKIHIHRQLASDAVLLPYLPDTAVATSASLRKWMSRYPAIILKPNSSSVGLGIMKIQKSKQRWRWYYQTRKFSHEWNYQSFQQKIPRRLLRIINTRKYLVQQMIPLATYENRPFDIRVSVQKGGCGEWRITGIVGRVAAPKTFLTNMAQGGEAMPLSHLMRSQPQWDPISVEEEISFLSLRIASRLDQQLGGLADLGLDIGLTTEGTPMFIESNGRDQRYSFRKGNLPELWQASYRQPMAYARMLLDEVHAKEKHTAQ